MASEGITIFAVLHQIRQEIFDMVDDTILLSEGRVVYVGPTAEIGSYFSMLGRGHDYSLLI